MLPAGQDRGRRARELLPAALSQDGDSQGHCWVPPYSCTRRVCSPGHRTATLPAAVWGGCANQAVPPTQIPLRRPKTESGREDTDPGVNIILVATAPRAFQMSPPSVMHLL